MSAYAIEHRVVPSAARSESSSLAWVDKEHDEGPQDDPQDEPQDDCRGDGFAGNISCGTIGWPGGGRRKSRSGVVGSALFADAIMSPPVASGSPSPTSVTRAKSVRPAVYGGI
jgi:hypothetical protein